MYLARFVVNAPEWRQAFQKRDAGTPQLPVGCLKSFMPTDSEVDHISTYQLTDLNDYMTLSAAFWLVTKGTFAIVAAPERDVSAKFTLKNTLGQTDYDVINSLHRDIKTPRAEDPLALASLFLSHGSLITIDPSEIRDRVANDNAAGLVDLYKLAKAAKGQRPTRIVELVGFRSVELKPASLKSS